MAQSEVTKSDLSRIVSGAMAAVTAVAAQPNNLSPAAVEQSKPEIKAEMAKEVAAVVAHVTNNEPWYQSRVTLGSILAVLAGLAGVFGFAFPAEMQGKVIEAAVALAPLIGGAFALWGRWVSKKPLGA